MVSAGTCFWWARTLRRRRKRGFPRWRSERCFASRCRVRPRRLLSKSADDTWMNTKRAKMGSGSMDEAFGTTRQTSRSDLIWAAVVGLGAAVTFTGAQAFPENPPCPTKQLAPFGLAPVPNQCATADCLLLSKGYKWWTSYTYNNFEFFKNNGLGTYFAPNHVFLDANQEL